MTAPENQEKSGSSGIHRAARLSIAPMMDWTDSRCRLFHRQFTRHALLYTEMVTTGAVLNGDRDRLLGYNSTEHPIALQLGGSDPSDLRKAVFAALEYEYDEFNLNVGCPSDRVQSGCFGAALMRTPDLVVRCAVAMKEAAGGVPVTVKCRLGVDEQDPREVLPDLLQRLADAGIVNIVIHARKAWLDGLSPKQNRDIPPLDFGLVREMKVAFPGHTISINGGIMDLDAAEEHLRNGLDGVMIGRAAYHSPAILGQVDRRIFGATSPDVSGEAAVRAMLPHIETHLSGGARLNQFTRHMLGTFQGRPGARAWRRLLSEGAHKEGAGPELVEAALAQISGPDEAAVA